MAFNTSSGFIGITNEATLALYGGTEIAAALDAYLGSSAWRSDSWTFPVTLRAGEKVWVKTI